MAAHTKIVDFFGLPGCGKSTLVSYIKETQGERIKIATIYDLLDDIKKEKKYRKLLSVSPLNLLNSILFRLTVPFDEKRKDRSILNWVKHGILYNYARKYSDYDIVLVDEGNIQNFVKFERGDDLHNNKMFVKACKNYIQMSPVTLYVYCGIDTEIANERIIGRNRAVGRIDVIKDDKTRTIELEKEMLRFDFFYAMLKLNAFDVAKLEMVNTLERIAETLLQRLSCN